MSVSFAYVRLSQLFMLSPAYEALELHHRAGYRHLVCAARVRRRTWNPESSRTYAKAEGRTRCSMELGQQV